MGVAAVALTAAMRSFLQVWGDVHTEWSHVLIHVIKIRAPFKAAFVLQPIAYSVSTSGGCLRR